MPYIDKELRDPIDDHVEEAIMNIETDGDMNYAITKLLMLYADKRGFNYETVNRIMGILNCVQHEYYRRFASPYEDTKIRENGDII